MILKICIRPELINPQEQQADASALTSESMTKTRLDNKSFSILLHIHDIFNT